MTSITVTLFTVATGIIGDMDTFTFRVHITATDSEGNSETTFETSEHTGDVAGESVKFTVSAMVSVSYVFSVRAENRFGTSEYSRNSESITPPNDNDDGRYYTYTFTQ